MQFAALLKIITEILRAIHAKAPLEVVMQKILGCACKLSNSVHGSFVRVDHETGALQIASTFGPDWTPEIKKNRLKVGEGITGRVAATGVPCLCNDTAADPDYVPFFDYVRSELAIPILVGEKVWGIINVDGTRTGEYDENTLVEMTLFAQLAASAIDVQLKWEREQELQQELLQADKMSSVGKLIAGIAHEINNPLTAIMGSASLLSLELMRPENRQAAQVIEQQAARAGDLVKQLLGFSRKSSDLKAGPLSINEVVREACDLVKPQLRLKNISLAVSMTTPSAIVSSHKTKLQQVLLNLITNGQHAIEERGIGDGRIEVQVESAGAWAHIRVTDNGIGMSPDVRAKIFDPFFTTKREGVGTGLGMSIVQEAVYEHGARLTLSTQQDRGTQFTLSLPAVQPSSHEAAPVAENGAEADSVAVAASPSMRTLIVDDEESIRYILTRFLTGCGMAVSAAASGEEAVELLNQETFDIVISDVHMPGMSGIDLYRRLRDAPNGSRNATFILITGDIFSPEVRNVQPGQDFVLMPKPFNPSDLLQHLPVALVS